MTPIRTNNLYISSQLNRWLKWAAELEPEKTVTPDSLAEYIVRKRLVEMYPDIEKVEADYWTARNKLDSETVNKLKEQTAKTDKPM